MRITTRNARFQQWAALLTNRTKRQRSGEFLVQGVRPITLAVEHGRPIRSLLYAHGRRLSSWAQGVLDETAAERVAMAPELLDELAGKEDAELVAVAALPPDDLARITPDGPVVVFDRAAEPGNIGTVVRSADAFGASGVIVTGHAADPYDPKSVRASTGSLFALPVLRVPAPRQVVDWARENRLRVVGTDETGTVDVGDSDLRGPALLVIGNETRGMSGAWTAACDEIVRIPIVGAASSLNAASAATVFLYEAARQRGVAAETEREKIRSRR
ncbi:TrmH family RNA methyltransferase [Actinoallomurus rhizosphaericola]|uniref:TrmH family RNA methyltransferase n=1 Tax=Actinoallomurus rhizosphaericola TaxID=2952536 RepID=UPI002093E599|nr:TrmH family RNA methyltransferase [Actinoallomurus rhizosphaericola]MCO5999952.1 rRNA methyltransferase [Actinoallomurus rhizosphaericola]